MSNREVWELVDPPKGARVIGSRWVYTTKSDEKNNVKRCKARLVTPRLQPIVRGRLYRRFFTSSKFFYY